MKNIIVFFIALSLVLSMILITRDYATRKKIHQQEKRIYPSPVCSLSVPTTVGMLADSCSIRLEKSIQNHSDQTEQELQKSINQFVNQLSEKVDSVNIRLGEIQMGTSKSSFTNESIYELVEHISHKTKHKPNLLYHPDLKLEIGERANFVVIGKPGDVVDIRNISGTASITRDYAITSTGVLVNAQETSISFPTNLEFPIEGFGICQLDTGYSIVSVSINNETADTIMTTISPRTIYYTIDTLYTKDFQKQKDITCNIKFSENLIRPIYFDIAVILCVNSKKEVINKKITIPAGTSEYRTTVSYPYGRSPYSFEVENISIVCQAEHPGITYLHKPK